MGNNEKINELDVTPKNTQSSVSPPKGIQKNIANIYPGSTGNLIKFENKKVSK